MNPQYQHLDELVSIPAPTQQPPPSDIPPPPPSLAPASQHPTGAAGTWCQGAHQPANNNNATIEVGPIGGASIAPPKQNEMGEAAVANPPVSCNVAEESPATTRFEDIQAAAIATNEPAMNPVVVESVTSIRSKILAARKAPEEVAQLIATQTEQLTVPVYKRPPDGAFWRVRSGGEWDPQLSEVLLLPRKDGGGGPEFLLVLPGLEPVFNNDPRLRNMVRYHHLAFTVDSRGRVGWWAVPSRSENDWHVSARTAMRRLTDEWGMIKSDQGAKSYKLEKPVDNLGDPIWPAGSYDDWFVKGLSDKVVDALDHPVLRELQGRK